MNRLTLLPTIEHELRRNQVLAALPEVEYRRLEKHLLKIALPVGTVIYQRNVPITHVVFPNNGIISLVAVLKDGSQTEVGIVGNEGLVGLPLFWGGEQVPRTAFVQIEGDGMAITAADLHAELGKRGALGRLIHLYTQGLFTQISQVAACNRHHPIEQRCSSWLLEVQDRVQRDEFELQTRFLMQMLGVSRSKVLFTIHALQNKGFIRYSRAVVTIINRKALEQSACECYSVIADEYARLSSLMQSGASVATHGRNYRNF
jgi:CRP-like cAMP-binding protein